MYGQTTGVQWGSAASRAPGFILSAVVANSNTKTSRGSHRVDARQLHADVDHHDGEDLPADTSVCEQTPDGESLDGGQGALLFLHLLHLSLDVPLFTEPF